ncbi:galactosamine 6-phosphate isomerase AgaS [Plantibacter sp. VKM Ac-1784]|uniref:Galactosamine 6-phosphate isomerase AgaS n=1 Tax=Plantibacter elymi (nom. nud.) TaxID=199708 RepID=A0ABY1RHB6_9MICO|nr:SIS domain-containing protein [Plantibacter sp. VKM Ac-1784]SMQ73162.1 galactosamine 6-phosphate isomerase AgaS [Plantibacter sp. VKM Ac-1784]
MSITTIVGSEATVREITQQPDVWLEASTVIAARREEIDAFLAPLLARPELRIVLTGAGTSAFIGEIAAPALTRTLRRRIDAVATTDIVSNPQESFAEDVPLLLVSFARSGNSPESVAATELADQSLAEVHHLVITCDETGELYRRHHDRASSLTVLMPLRSNDEGFAMTSSFSSMLLSVLLILGGADDAAVQALAAGATTILDQREVDIRALANEGCERVVYIGSGPLTGLARESALKLLELTAGRIVTYYDSALGFRHGPKAVVDDSTLVVVYLSSDPYTRRYDLDIVTELRATLSPERVIAISSEPVDGATAYDWVLPELAGLDDAQLAIGYVLVAQLLGLSYSLQLGATPDNPFPSGTVNRVVQGVRIHEFDGVDDARSVAAQLQEQ